MGATSEASRRGVTRELRDTDLAGSRRISPDAPRRNRGLAGSDRLLYKQRYTVACLCIPGDDKGRDLFAR